MAADIDMICLVLFYSHGNELFFCTVPTYRDKHNSILTYE